jgi:nicotinamide mononucleotide transporter
MIETMIEISAVIMTLLCVYLLNLKKTIGWLFGILGAALFFMVYLNSDLLFQTGLQVVYVLQSAYGWWIWNKDKNELKLKEVGKVSTYMDVGLAVLFSVAVMLYFDVRTLNSFLDVLTTVLALVATYYLSKKIVEAWTLWVLVNILLIGLCILNSLWWTLGLELILLGVALDATYTWGISLKHQNYSDGKSV